MGLRKQRQPKPVTMGEDLGPGQPADVGDALTVRARLRPAQLREVGEGGQEEQGDGRYRFTAEISSMAVDSYHTHMADSTLRNFARDAAQGVSLLDSHDGYKLGVGYSDGGRYEEQDGAGRAVADFYIVPGLEFGGRHSYASTDDYIRAIEGGVVRDMSVGFYGGRWVCDLCHQPYFGQGGACPHLAGWEYEIETGGQMQRQICTVTIHDARLSEVSLVYDGATPGAMILKAEQEAAAGRMSPAMVREFESQYRVKLWGTGSGGQESFSGLAWTDTGTLPQASTTWSTTASTAGVVVVNGRAAVEAPATDGQGEVMEEDLELEEVETVEPQADAAEGVNAGDEEARAAVAEVRQALLESAAPQGVGLAEAVRALNAQLAEATRERDEARAEVARLQPLADQGRAYREELVNQAVAEGVRAMGEGFPEETYRAMLAGATLEHIRQVRDTFAGQAAERFPGGRQTRDQEQEQPERAATPAAAYGVK